MALLQSDSLNIALRDTARIAREALDGEVAGALMDSLSALGSEETNDSEAVEAVAGVFEGLIGGLQEATGFSATVLTNLILTVLLFVVLWALRRLVIRIGYRQTADVRTRYQWRKSTSYAAAILGAFLLFRIWVGSLGSMATFFGLLSAGLAIALKDPLSNFAGWIFIVWRRPFVAGDRITVRTHTGDVIDLRVFMFTLLEVGTETGAGQSTGRLVHVPNGWLFTDSVVNFTRGFPYVWNEIPVVLTFESNWRAAKQILFEIAAEHGSSLSEDAERKLRHAAQEYMIFYSQLTPTVYTSVLASSVQLTIRYLVEPRRRRGSEQQIWEAVLDAFAVHDDIDFAYPTQRMFYNAIEGKPGTRPEAQFGTDNASGLPESPPPVLPEIK